MTLATRIIAVRHGETAWNVDTRIQGQLDIGLNERGRWQAERVGRALAEEPMARIYSSDLQRAHHTARAIAAARAQQLAQQGDAGQAPTAHAPDALIALHPGLRERGFGKFEGHTYAAIEKQWPDEARRWRQRDPHFAPVGGETPTEVIERVGSAVNNIAQQHLGELVVLVAHGGVLDMLYRLATQQGVDAPRTWELGNTSINRLLWTPQGLTLVGWADTRHLEDSALDEFGT